MYLTDQAKERKVHTTNLTLHRSEGRRRRAANRPSADMTTAEQSGAPDSSISNEHVYVIGTFAGPPIRIRSTRKLGSFADCEH